MKGAIEYLEKTREQGLRELKEFVAIPSVSSQPDRSQEVERAAVHLKEQLTRAGLQHAEVIATRGHPVVYADWLNSPGKPTVLVYGHYDVQPVDPLDLWEAPPFEPVQRDGFLFGRGASDDKGQIAIHWQAIQACLTATGSLPLNLKLIAEGEEEIGSPNFEAFADENRERLRADYCVVSDTAMAARGLPAVTYGLRGLVYFEIKVETANSDLHSGAYGGVAANPIQVLGEILAGLKDRSGRVLIPGFYDAVRQLTDEERRQFARVPFDETALRREFALEGLHGEPGFTPQEREWGRPTLDANGIWGGYQGPGSKTIIPAYAVAKVSCRLVPDQDPAAIAAGLTERVMSLRPPWARVQVTEQSRGEPWITPVDHPLLQAGRRALTAAYGKEPAFIRSGGSIGAVDVIARRLNIPCLLVGFVLPDSRAHAPNERLDLDSFFAGRRAVVGLWEEIGPLRP